MPAPVVVVEGLPYTDSNLQELRVAFALNGSYAFNYTSLTALGKADSLALVMPSWEKGDFQIAEFSDFVCYCACATGKAGIA